MITDGTGPSLRRGMRVAAVLVSFVLWASPASAGPGIIVASRVEAFDAPSESGSVVSELGHGAAVLVLDEETYDGVVHRRPGWLAIRLPGGGCVNSRRRSTTSSAPVSPFNGMLGLTIYDIFTISTSVDVDKGFRHERQRIIEHG